VFNDAMTQHNGINTTSAEKMQRSVQQQTTKRK